MLKDAETAELTNASWFVAMEECQEIAGRNKAHALVNRNATEITVSFHNVPFSKD